MKILLINYDHNVVGGCETMYKYLHKAFPNSELISFLDKFRGNNIKEKSKELDKYLIERNKKEKILVIKEVELGGVLDTSEVPQINLYQNPYLQIMNEFNIGYDPWTFEKKKISGKRMAVSNYIARNLEKAEVIPNCADTAIFKPIENKKLKSKYNLPEGQKIGIWIGAPNAVKNFQMILNLVEYFQDIFWILISKEEFISPYFNSKVFNQVDKNTVNELLNCADFFILTSKIESCGISFFEAMSVNLPCIISKAGYFWDFWDKRIGIQIKDSDSFNEHKEAIEKINEINTDSRKVLIEQGLDYDTYKNKWNEIIKKYG